jgi:hypothetical protein
MQGIVEFSCQQSVVFTPLVGNDLGRGAAEGSVVAA